jgi:hypothetical protein
MGQVSIGGALVADVVVAAPGEASSGILVNATASQAAAITRARDGSIIAQTAPKVAIRLDAAVRWKTDGWAVTAVHVYQPGDPA